MTPERRKEFEDRVATEDRFDRQDIVLLLAEIDFLTKELSEVCKELSFQKEFFQEMNDQRQGLIIRMMKAELLNKNLVKNLSQTIQERDKAERDLAALRGK